MALVEHSNQSGLKHYLSGQVLKAKEPIYLVEAPPLRGRKRPRLIGVTKESIAHLLPAKASPAEAQGVEKAIIHRDYSLDNLSSVALNGRVYRIQG